MTTQTTTEVLGRLAQRNFSTIEAGHAVVLGCIERSTEKAVFVYLVRGVGERGEYTGSFWLPRSQIKIGTFVSDPVENPIAAFQVPLWLLRDKGIESRWFVSMGDPRPERAPGTDAQPVAPQGAPERAAHNGTYKITRYKEPKTPVVTWRIRTQPVNARFAPGARILSYLAGARQFVGVGFVTHDTKASTLNIFKKYVGTVLESEAKSALFTMDRICAARFERAETIDLEDVEEITDEETSCRVVIATRCVRCGRELTDPKSVRAGIGPICIEK